MKEKLTEPNFNFISVDQYLINLGVPISKSLDGYEVTSVRLGGLSTVYGFKNIEDYNSFTAFLTANQIEYKYQCSDGARYPHHAIFK
jgi:hypothetical protein